MLSCHPETIGKWVFQPIVHGYIPDFCNDSAKLIVEVDGGVHSSEKVREYDARRTRHLKKRGYTVIRFANESLSRSPEKVMKAILRKQEAVA
jgi:very-short-patch-repair endonuclease